MRAQRKDRFQSAGSLHDSSEEGSVSVSRKPLQGLQMKAWFQSVGSLSVIARGKDMFQSIRSLCRPANEGLVSVSREPLQPLQMKAWFRSIGSLRESLVKSLISVSREPS